MHEFDVEVMGKTGHTAHVYVLADDGAFGDAEEIVSQQFPELEVTGNTRDNGEVK